MAVSHFSDGRYLICELKSLLEHRPYSSLLTFRKELNLRLVPGGADFREAVAKEVASVEQRYAQKEAEQEEKLAEGRKQYAALEDEFRMALTIEAARFSEVWHTSCTDGAQTLQLCSFQLLLYILSAFQLKNYSCAQ